MTPINPHLVWYVPLWLPSTPHPPKILQLQPHTLSIFHNSKRLNLLFDYLLCYDIPICTFPYSHVTLTHIPKSHSFIPLLYCSHCHAEHRPFSIYIPIPHTSFSLFKPFSYLQRQFNGRICAEGGGGRKKKEGGEGKEGFGYKTM